MARPGRAEFCGYDPDGNLTGTTDADGHPITWTYDALGRKTGEYDGPSATSPQLASWAYDNSNNAVPAMTDPVGKLTTETSYSGTNAYTIQQKGFNVFGESLGETDTLPASEGALAGSYTLTHTYTATTGLPFHDTYPASPGGGTLPAETAGWTYVPGFDLPNGMGGSINAYVQNVTYTAFFQVAQEEIGTSSNAYITNTYDPHTGNLTDSQTENRAISTTPFDDTSYAYDPAGNIKSQTGTRNGTASETQCFTYDTLDRLTQAWTATDSCAANPASNAGATVGDGVTGGAYWTSWQFDPLGDQTTQTQHSLTGGKDAATSYSYNGNGTSQPNTLTSAATTSTSGTTTASYAYDADGNTLTRSLPSGKQTLTWTHDGKLATDTTPAGTTSYLYDADGNILLQKDPGQTTAYLFGGAQQLVLNTGTSAITGTRILNLPGGGQAIRTGAGTAYSFTITDQHGTSLLTLDNTAANPVWRQFTPYGAPRGTPPASWPDANAFLGKPADPATSLDIIGARQYDPATGRFLSVHPVLDPAQPQNLGGYAYAADNPVSQSDPTGLCPSTECGGVSQPGPRGHRRIQQPYNPCTSNCWSPPATGSSGGGDGDGILGAGAAGGILIRITHPTMVKPPPGLPEGELNLFGMDTYLGVLDATKAYFDVKPMAMKNYALVIARVTTEDGAIRTIVFTSKGGLPITLRNEFEALGVEAYQLDKLPASQSHAEAAALDSRETAGRMPVEQRITSVHDAYSTNQVCAACGGKITKFIGRQGVVIPEDSHGWLGGEVLDESTLNELGSSTGVGGTPLDIATGFYRQYMIDVTGIASEEDR